MLYIVVGLVGLLAFSLLIMRRQNPKRAKKQSEKIELYIFYIILSCAVLVTLYYQ